MLGLGIVVTIAFYHWDGNALTVRMALSEFEDESNEGERKVSVSNNR